MIWRGRTGQESSRGETLIPSQPDSRGPASGARRAPGRLIAGIMVLWYSYSTCTSLAPRIVRRTSAPTASSATTWLRPWNATS